MTSDNDFVFVQRHPAIITGAYKVELDEYRRADGDTILVGHIRVLRWSPSVFKEMKHVWATLRKCVTCPIFGCPQVDDARWHKFVTSLGFRPLQQTICNNGERRPLYIHTI